MSREACSLWIPFIVALIATPVPRTARGETVRLPIARDTWFSAYPGEMEANLGGASRMKLKSIQEMSLIDFDPAPLRGRVIRRATLHVRLAGDEVLRRVTVSTFGSAWEEGTSRGYERQVGSSSFRWRKTPDEPWTSAAPDVPGGGDLCFVMLGQGGTFWRMADATPPDPHGWQTIAVDPRLIGARVAEISHGLLLFDDTGSEWIRQGEQFTIRLFPNRYIYSRDQNAASAPYLIVELGEEDRAGPSAPTDVQAFVTAPRTGEPLPPGEVIVQWRTPPDIGSAGVVGFVVHLDGARIPRYLVPAAGNSGDRVTMHLRDLGLRAGQEVTVEVTALDAAGNAGEPMSRRFVTSDYAMPPISGSVPRSFTAGGESPRLADAEVFIVDALDKIHPITGRMIPPQDESYRSGNHLFSARERRVRLAAARGEFTDFQIVLHGDIKDVHATLALDDGTWIGSTDPSHARRAPDYQRGIDIRFSRFRHVKSEAGPLPDPVLPMEGPLSVPMPDDPLEGQRYASLLCELYVSHDERLPAGPHRGVLTLTSGTERLELAVDLWVWNFHIPNRLSFLPEMNAYGLPANERDYYRVAHLHRTVMNRVPYSQSGVVAAGCAPARSGSDFDWSTWDERFGPLLSGAAFEDLPRRGVPIECFYLPLHENWPSPMEGNYNGDYWADRAFPPAYRQALVDTAKLFAEHFANRGHTETIFQVYLNNKNNFKESGWSRGSSPWLLDEPANYQDYWALRYFGEAFHEGFAQARAAVGPSFPIMHYRADISRPEWQRETLDHVLDYNVVGGSAFKRYNRMVLDRKRQLGQIVIPYGTTNPIEESNMQPVGWSLDSWNHGGDGIVPWQTIGRGESWKTSDQLALFYPGASIGRDGVFPSIRLKAYRRGQQDIEYLTLLAQNHAAHGQAAPRWAIAEAVQGILPLQASHRGTGAAGEDAGVTAFDALRPQDAWALRIHVARQLDRIAPARNDQSTDFRLPPRDPASGTQAFFESP